MFPYKTSFHLNKNKKQALYLQLANQFINLIKDRKLPPKTKLPGSRTLADLLEVHRKTIVACYDELLLQGWVESIPQKGTFVHPDLPELQQQDFIAGSTNINRNVIGFDFYTNEILEKKAIPIKEGFMYLNDGISDTR